MTYLIKNVRDEYYKNTWNADLYGLRVNWTPLQKEAFRFADRNQAKDLIANLDPSFVIDPQIVALVPPDPLLRAAFEAGFSSCCGGSASHPDVAKAFKEWRRKARWGR